MTWNTQTRQQQEDRTAHERGFAGVVGTTLGGCGLLIGAIALLVLFFGAISAVVVLNEGPPSIEYEIQNDGDVQTQSMEFAPIEGTDHDGVLVRSSVDGVLVRSSVDCPKDWLDAGESMVCDLVKIETAADEERRIREGFQPVLQTGLLGAAALAVSGALLTAAAHSTRKELEARLQRRLDAAAVPEWASKSDPA